MAIESCNVSQPQFSYLLNGAKTDDPGGSWGVTQDGAGHALSTVGLTMTAVITSPASVPGPTRMTVFCGEATSIRSDWSQIPSQMLRLLQTTPALGHPQGSCLPPCWAPHFFQEPLCPCICVLSRGTRGEKCGWGGPSSPHWSL